MSEYIIKEEIINILLNLVKPNSLSISFIGEIVTAPEIVRCRECKYNAFLGKEPNWCDAIECFIKPDGFCAWGVRRC